MDTKTLEALFFKKLNSLSEKDLLERLNDVPPTGLGDLIHEDRIYSRLENQGIHLHSPIHKVKTASRRYKVAYSNRTKFLLGDTLECEQDFVPDMAA